MSEKITPPLNAVKHRAVIGIGSNIQPKEYIKKAQDILNSHYPATRWSSLYPTKPVDVPTDQPDFINCACLLKVSCSLGALREQLKQIERQLGRPPNSSMAPRCIDIDILMWGGALVHKDVYTRAFWKDILLELLSPAEIAPFLG